MGRISTEIGKGHLQSHLREALSEDSRLNVLDIEVLIVEGRVHLHGDVPSHELRRIAQLIAEEVCVGMPIENRLQVSEPVHEARTEQIR